MSSTVGTTTGLYATSYTFQHKCFYHNGRFWVFYFNGTNIVWRTSTDNVSWSDETVFTSSSHGYYFTLYFDGTYAHCAYSDADAYPYPALFYRRGIPSGDGTISWTDEQTAVAAVSNQWYVDLSITVDSVGRAVIAYWHCTLTDNYAKVTLNSSTDGSWSTAGGFPVSMLTTSAATSLSVVPLTSEKWYVTYAGEGGTVKGRLYNESLGDEETASSSNISQEEAHCLVSSGDDVLLVFLKETSYDIVFVKRTYGVGWGDEVAVKASAISSAYPVLSAADSGDLYCFWASSPTQHHIYYKKYSGGSWDVVATDWIDESTDNLTGLATFNRLTVFSKQYGSSMGVAYMTKPSSPYNVRFNYLPLEAGDGADGVRIELNPALQRIKRGYLARIEYALRRIVI